MVQGHAHLSTRCTSMLHPTTVSTPPSDCGSSNHIPCVAPSFASTRSERVLRWSGAANSSLTVVRRDDDVAQEHPQQPGAEPPVDEGRLTDDVVVPDRIRVAAQQRELGMVGDPVVLAEAHRAPVDLPDPVPDGVLARGCPVRSRRPPARAIRCSSHHCATCGELTHLVTSGKSPSVIGRSAKRCSSSTLNLSGSAGQVHRQHRPASPGEPVGRLGPRLVLTHLRRG